MYINKDGWEEEKTHMALLFPAWFVFEYKKNMLQIKYVAFF